MQLNQIPGMTGTRQEPSHESIKVDKMENRLLEHLRGPAKLFSKSCGHSQLV